MSRRPQVVNVDCNFVYDLERSQIEAAGGELVLRRAKTEDEIIAACADATVVLLEFPHTPLTARVISALPATSPLRSMEQVVMTPHYAASSLDSMAHLHRTVADSVEAILRGFWPPFPVNTGVQPRDPLRPWSEFRPPS